MQDEPNNTNYLMHYLCHCEDISMAICILTVAQLVIVTVV